MYKYVEDQEFNYMELIRQKEAVSPRAIEQGWVEELAKNVRDHRNQITKYANTQHATIAPPLYPPD